MQRIAGTILVGFALLVSFGNAFALHRWLPLPLAALLVGAAVVILSLPFCPTSRLRVGYFGTSDLFLIGFSGMIGLGVLFTGDTRIKNMTHAFAYTTVILIYGLFLKALFAIDGAGDAYRQRIRGAIALSTFLVSSFAVAEFVDTNWLHVGITRLVPFPLDTNPYNPQFFIFTRARGFEAESAFLALYLNICLPMSVVWARTRLGRLASLGLLACGSAAFIVTFSTAGAIALCVGLCAAALLYLADHGLADLPVRVVVVALASTVLLIGAVSAAPIQVRSAIWSKLSFGASTSSEKRLAAWEAAVPLAEAHPLLGTGVGSTSQETGEGVISFYLTMLKEAGIPALLFIVAYLVMALVRVAQLPPGNSYKYAYAIGLTAGVIHYVAISDIWYPWIWLLCVLIVDEAVASAASRGGRLVTI